MMAVQGNSPLQVWIVGDDTGGGGGGGGAVTIADGADVALGATTDAESASGDATVIAILKRIRTLMGAGLPTVLNATDTLRTALYGRSSSDGDKAIRTDSSGFLYGRLLSGVSNYQHYSTEGVNVSAGNAIIEITPYQLEYHIGMSPRIDYQSNTSGLLRWPLVNDTLKSISTSLATLTSGTVWTPGGGRKFRLRALYASSDVSGEYQLLDNASIFAYFYLAANVWTKVFEMDINGYKSAVALNPLKIYNGTASTAAVRVIAVGTEE
jgi:hypothetical protein